MTSGEHQALGEHRAKELLSLQTFGKKHLEPSGISFINNISKLVCNSLVMLIVNYYIDINLLILININLLYFK